MKAAAETFAERTPDVAAPVSALVGWLRRPLGPYRVTALVMVVTVALGFLTAALVFRRDTIDREREMLARLGLIMDGAQQRRLDRTRQMIEAFVGELRLDAEHATWRSDDFEKRAAERLRTLDGNTIWALVDSAGKVIRPDYMDGQADFSALVHQAAATGGNGAVWGEPTEVGGHQFWALPIAQRIQIGPHGPLLVIAGLVPVASLLSSLSPAAVDAGTRIAISRGGETLASLGLPEDAGPFLRSVRPLGQTGLQLVVARTERATFAAWYRQVGSLAILAVAVCAGMLMLLEGLARQARGQGRIRRALALRNAMLERAQANLVFQTEELEVATGTLRTQERQLAERSHVLDTTLQHIDQGVLMVDQDGYVLVYNRHVLEMLDLPEALLAGRPHFSEVLSHQFANDEFLKTEQTLVEFIKAGGIVNSPRSYVRERPNGRVLEILSLPLGSGGFVRTFADITERRRAEKRIEEAAHVDELTRLPNRLSLREEVGRRLAEASTGPRIGLFYLNLNRFRLLNDARGHDVGDVVLIEVARRLQVAAGPDDLVARTGGDEFAILHMVDPSDDDTSALGEDLLDLLSGPIEVGDAHVTVTVSIGIAVATADTSTDGLLRSADVAMYRAKDTARHHLVRYDPAMTILQQERFHLEQSLREAIGTTALRLAYQPIFSLESQAVCGYEALLRWSDRARGNVPPSAFIPVAEATGLIVPLGRTVLEQACFEAASWPNGNTVAVNLSPAQFHDHLLIDTVRDVLGRSGLSPHRLELEVTESMLIENVDAVHETIVELRKLGLSLTLDDFGTGHAGLSTLRRFPFHKIKIDRSFVSSLGSDAGGDAIVEAMLLLGRRLDLQVVAEGVETTDQLDQLRRMQCPLVQGYLTGRPQFFDSAQAA